MPDVKYHTTGFTELGAFMVALSRQSPDTYPKTVEDFMQMLSAYVNHFFYGAAANEIDKSKPSPDIPPGLASKGPGQARFIPHAGDEKDAIGSWVLDGILEVQNVQRNATMQLFQNSAQHVNIRLPERENIANKEQDAVKKMAQTPPGKFEKMTYLDAYFSDSPTMTAMEFVWANVGDYTTRSCR